MKIQFVFLIILFTSPVLQAQNWLPLAGGTDWPVTSFFADTITNQLYIGGRFKSADGKNIRGIGIWDGQEWKPMGPGLDANMPSTYPGPTFSITRYNNQIIIGGMFSQAGLVATKALAIWDGNEWQEFPEAVNGAIWNLNVFDNELYVSGWYSMAGNTQVNSIGKWNGSSWVSLNFPYTSYGIGAMCWYKGELYVAGNFFDVNIPEASNIAKWDGIQWSPVGNGISGGNSFVSTLCVFEGDLYIGGFFDKSNGNPGNYIAKWNGSTWSELGEGIGGQTSPQVDKLIVHNNELYVCGSFQTAGGIEANNIAKWDGNRWCGLDGVFDGAVRDLVIFRDTLYIGGGFWTIDGDSINRIAKWAGGNYVDTCSEPVGVRELKKMDVFHIYPNPTHGKISIEIKVAQSIEAIEVFNSLGQMVERKTMPFSNAPMVDLDLSPNLPGLYFVSVETSEGRAVKKVIKY